MCGQSHTEGKAIIVILMLFSALAWSVMAAKAMQMRRAKKLNQHFEAEFRSQKHVLDVYDRRLQVPDCPLHGLPGRLPRTGHASAQTRFHGAGNACRKAMEHVKRTLENTVAQQSLRLSPASSS
jgi:biopolymer transport protein ExbB/TolQ